MKDFASSSRITFSQRSRTGSALRKVLASPRSTRARSPWTWHAPGVEALEALLQASTGQITVRLIQRTVADYYKIRSPTCTARVPTSHRRRRSRVAMTWPDFTQKSLPEIASCRRARTYDRAGPLWFARSRRPCQGLLLNHALHCLSNLKAEACNPVDINC